MSVLNQSHHPTKATTSMSAAEFAKHYPESNDHIELVKGQVVMLSETEALSSTESTNMPTPKDIHQHISLLLTLLIGNFIIKNSLGALHTAPSDVYFSEDTVLQPDLFFVANANPNCTLKDDGYWHGTPDLCIEIISPSSNKHDRVTKMKLYAEFGVGEYWIIDPEGRFVEVYRLQNQTFQRIDAYGEGQTFQSPVLQGFTIPIQDILPPKSAPPTAQS